MCYLVWGMEHIKDPLLLKKRLAHVVAAAGFLSRYLNGALPYDQRHLTVIYCVEYVVK